MHALRIFAILLGPLPVGLHAASANPVAEQSPFAAIPNVSVEYYDVAGHTDVALRRAIEERGLVDERDGLPVDALSRTFLTWRWTDSAVRSCVPVNPEVTFSASVVLPRLAEGVALAPALGARWRRYVTALEAHEAGHLRNAFALVGPIKDAIARSSCSEADAAARAAIAGIDQRDEEYDRATDHGRKQGAVFP